MQEQSETQAKHPFRRWVLVTGGGILAVLGLLALEVAIFDPFMHYHAPWFGYRFVSWKEAYLNPGLVRHEAYNAIIVGGSYVENTKISQFNPLFGVEALKVTNAGGTPGDIGRQLEMGLDSGRVKLAVVAIPLTKFESAQVEALRHELPEYLYDDDWINDLSYLWNLDVYLEQAKALWASFRHPRADREQWLDEAYSWYGRYKDKSGKKYLLGHYDPPAPGDELPADFYLDRATKQFDTHLKPYLDRHPEVVFKFFFPPFSQLLWRDKLVEGKLRAELEIKRLLAKRLLAYPNVELYDFMAMPQTSDLENYKDRTHYLPVVNDVVMHEMAGSGYRMTSSPSDADIDAFLALIRAYHDPDIPQAAAGKRPRPDRDDNIDNF